MAKESLIIEQPVVKLLINEAKQQGYREGYIELAVKQGLLECVSQSELNSYYAAKQKYNDDNSFEDMKHLIEITKGILS